MVLLSATAVADGHKPNHSGESAFAVAVKAIKDKDYQEGLKRFIALAEAGDAEAQYNVAVLLRSGRGRPQNYREAYFWSSLSRLGQIEQAEDVADEIESKLADGEKEELLEQVRLFLMQRIDDGYLDSIPQLASFYTELLEEADYEAAYLWYTLAAALNIEETLPLRDDAEDELEPDQISAMQAEASQLFDRILAGETLLQDGDEDESQSQMAN